MAEIIVYFSRNGNNYVNGAIKNLTTGNAEVIANMLQELTNADIFKIEPVIPYSSDYSECIEEAKEDKRHNARPELKSYPKDMDKYDTIYLGYPNYWGTMPMAVFTFLEKYDLSGKTIMPFCTHEGSGMGSSESDIKSMCPNSNVKPGLPVHGANITKEQLKKWINL